MDKPLIKALLIAAFIITLIAVYVASYRALQDTSATPIEVTSPTPPAFTTKPALPANATPEQHTKYLELMKDAVAIDKTAIDAYANYVTAYRQEVDARITAAKANVRDRTDRLNAYEKVVKDTLANLILAPLLAALLVYSGIKVAGDVATTRALNARNEV